MAKTIASLALDVTPVVGSLKSLTELYKGEDLITGEPVPRWMSALGCIPIISSVAKALRGATNSVKVATNADTAAKIANEVAFYEKLAARAAASGCKIEWSTAKGKWVQTVQKNVLGLRSENNTRRLLEKGHKDLAVEYVIHDSKLKSDHGIDFLASIINKSDKSLKRILIAENKATVSTSGKIQLANTTHGKQMGVDWVTKKLNDMYAAGGSLREGALLVKNNPQLVYFRVLADRSSLRRWESYKGVPDMIKDVLPNLNF